MTHFTGSSDRLVLPHQQWRTPPGEILIPQLGSYRSSDKLAELENRGDLGKFEEEGLYAQSQEVFALFTHDQSQQVHERQPYLLGHGRRCTPGPFDCIECGHSSSSKADLLRHSSELQHLAYACKCGLSFSRMDVLDRHVETFVPNPKRYSCQYCGRYNGSNGFRRRDHLAMHIRNYHHHGPYRDDSSKDDTVITQLNLQCPICPHPNFSGIRGTEFEPQSREVQQAGRKSFASRSAFDRHMREEHNTTPYPCDIPGCVRVGAKGYFRKKDLQKHRRIIHSDAGNNLPQQAPCEDMPPSHMIPFTFKWENPATEVYVTGTFDDWGKTVPLSKIGDGFAKEVLLSFSAEKIYYKFVVDGNWTIDPSAVHERDEFGNVTNVITADQILASIEPSDVLARGTSHDENNSPPSNGGIAVNQCIEEDVPDCNLRSIDSLDSFRDSALGSSLHSEMSSFDLQGLPRTAQEEILIIITSDVELRGLFEEAASRIDKSRFVRNIRRLFLAFHQDLGEAIADRRELDALKIIQRHAQWLAGRLFDICNPDSGSKIEITAAYLNQKIDKRPMLENYLASVGAESNQVYHNKPEELNTSSEEDVESQNGQELINYAKFPNLERMKNFLVAGTPFQNLKRNTALWIRPVHRVQPKRAAAEDPALMGAGQLFPSSPSPESSPSKSSALSNYTGYTVPDTDSEVSDDDSDLSYDPDLVGEASEDRMSAPIVYFDKLRSLEQEVFENSGFAAHRHNNSFSKTDDNRFIFDRKSRGPPSADIDVQFTLALVISVGSGMLLRLLECYDTMKRIEKSLIGLQEAGYCKAQISILVQDGDREGVARLVQIEIEAICNLATALEELLKNVIDNTIVHQQRDFVDAEIGAQDDQIGLTSSCLKILSDMALLPHLLLNECSTVVWECTSQCLDLAVISYSGAHIQRFDLDHMEADMNSFAIPRSYEYHDQILRDLAAPPISNIITMRRRKFQCLDTFLKGAEPWVFHQDFCNLGSQRLCLSTTTNALSDIWGPAWNIVRDSEPGRIQQVDVGSGTIVLWLDTQQHGSDKIEVRPGEIFCHWMSLKDWNMVDIDEHQVHVKRSYLVESDTLLIGATHDSGLVLNDNCIPSSERLLGIKSRMNQQGALRHPNTARARRYIDSHAVQVQGSAMGLFAASGTVIYKRQKGQTMKESLVERWRHGCRNPMDLEAFSGVEISLCTQNARRRRLLHLLGSPTMHNYLRGISFTWVSEAVEYRYWKALRSPKHFRPFWESLTPDQLENVGDAIATCLDALEETGIDSDSRELRGLWIESFDIEGDSDGESDDESNDGQNPPSLPFLGMAQPRLNFFEEWIATLFRSEHTWTGFLEDSEECLTMAVLSTACLDFDHAGFGRRCSTTYTSTRASKVYKGYPVLQTSLQINTELLSKSKLKPGSASNDQSTVWNAKDLREGTIFCLGDHGTLRVLTAASRTCPTITEWTGVKSEIAKEAKNVAINEKILGRPKEKHHREHIRGKWAEKPLPVLIMSKSNKVAFSKE